MKECEHAKWTVSLWTWQSQNCMGLKLWSAVDYIQEQPLTWAPEMYQPSRRMSAVDMTVFIWLPTYRTVWTNTSVAESYLSWNHVASMRFTWYTSSWTFSWPHWTTIQEGLPDTHTAWSKHAPHCWWSSTSPKGTNRTGVVTRVYII